MKYKQNLSKNVGTSRISVVTQSLLGLSVGMLALTVAQAIEPTQAQSCDISVESRLIERSEEQVVESFRGNRDHIGRGWRDRLILTNERDQNGYLIFHRQYDSFYCDREYRATLYRFKYSLPGSNDIFTSPYGYETYQSCMVALEEFRIQRHGLRFRASTEDHSWDEAQRAEVVQACNMRLVRDHADTLLASSGGVPRSREYYCTGPLEVIYRDGKYRAWESRLVRFTPVYRAVSDREVERLRCEKIRGCGIRAQTTVELHAIEAIWIDRGCELLEEPVAGSAAVPAASTTVTQ